MPVAPPPRKGGSNKNNNNNNNNNQNKNREKNRDKGRDRERDREPFRDNVRDNDRGGGSNKNAAKDTFGNRDRVTSTTPTVSSHPVEQLIKMIKKTVQARHMQCLRPLGCRAL